MASESKGATGIRAGLSRIRLVLIGVILAYGLKYHMRSLIISCISVCIVGGLIIFYAIRSNVEYEPVQLRAPVKRFQFLNRSNWSQQKKLLHSKPIDTAVVEESFLISETVDDICNLVIQEFVDGWFHHVSQDRELFQMAIHRELAHVSTNLKDRLKQVDFAKLFAMQLLPIINKHFDGFVRAEKLSGGSSGKLPGNDMERHVAIAQQYESIHRGVTIPKLGSVTTSDGNERKFFREIVTKIISNLLSEDERGNVLVFSLVREILTCTILTNVFSMLSEGDFYNLLIVKLIGDNLKHRTQVQKLREALAEHTNRSGIKSTDSNNTTDLSSTTANTSNNSSTIMSTGAVMLLSFSENTDTPTFRKILRNITQLTSLSDLARIQSQVTSKLAIAKMGSTYERRLKAILSETLRMVSECEKIHNDAEVNLSQILDNAISNKLFEEYLNHHKRGVLIQFWKAVENIKAPLEDAELYDDEEDPISLAFSNSEDINRIYTHFFYNSVLNINRASIETMEKYIESRGEKERTETYHLARKELLRLQLEVYQRMKDEDFPGFKRSDLYTKVIDIFRKREIKRTTEKVVGPRYTEDRGEEGDVEDDNGDNEEFDNDKVSPVVIKAVEDAFTEIMRSSNYKNERDIGTANEVPIQSSKLSQVSGNLSEPDRNPSTLHLKKNLFGGASNTLVGNRSSRLFDDDVSEEEEEEEEEEERGTKYVEKEEHGENSDDEGDGDEIEKEKRSNSGLDNDSVSSSPLDNSLDGLETSLSSSGLLSKDDTMSDSQVFLAAPGNLRLTEEIAKLDKEIDTLSEQNSILLPLLKKAELTNNVGELKILRKSKISLDREISSKELQKQQYIVQESDNSLYGKSRVSIQSYISGSDGGKEVILYIVEVQKLSSDNPDVVTAGWIVARRFSQFYKLNEYLKGRYSQFSSIKFPTRAVSMLKFQQKQIVELRKIALEEYLQEIIQIPQVCSDRAFRAFLSSENFNIRKNQFEETSKSMEMVANTFMRMIVPSSGNNTNSSNIGSSMNSQTKTSTQVNPQMLENFAEMQKELRMFDDTNDRGSFVKPICDVLISVFKLKTSKTWLRGRALVVILQQVFGTTIEKKAYEIVQQQLYREETVLDILTQIQRTVFPNGKFKDPPVIRSLYDRSSTKQEASVLLDVFFRETCSKLFGTTNTLYASSTIFDMLQNDILNKHLIFELFETIIGEIIPEI
ncbi:structural protein Mdm1p [[Candida] anglica]|uniref:Structural protein Mdm1p n=1 Tax=[Candida] anglica TaxID=148631 RepID=A0ABP0ENX4_9ASCO